MPEGQARVHFSHALRFGFWVVLKLARGRSFATSCGRRTRKNRPPKSLSSGRKYNGPMGLVGRPSHAPRPSPSLAASFSSRAAGSLTQSPAARSAAHRVKIGRYSGRIRGPSLPTRADKNVGVSRPFHSLDCIVNFGRPGAGSPQLPGILFFFFGPIPAFVQWGTPFLPQGPIHRMFLRPTGAPEDSDPFK